MFKLVLLAVVFLVYLTGQSHGHVFRFGACPEVEVQKDFEMKKFIGTWYVLQKFRTSSNCVRENIFLNRSDYYIQEHLEPVGTQLTQKGKVNFVDGEPESVMQVDYPYSLPLGKQNYWVVMTDYEQYAAVWSCQRLWFGHRESAQIMSRTTSLPREVTRKIRSRFESFHINEHYFSHIDHEKCGWEDPKRAGDSDKSFSVKLGPVEVANRR